MHTMLVWQRAARGVILAALLLGMLRVVPARGDTLSSTLGQGIVERSHDVEISVDGGVARYRVRREFENPGKVADEASLDIDLPFGGAVTGLRIRAHDRWYEGDLMEAEAAAALYEKLTGLGPFPVKDPALLQWVWADKVHLQIFPVLPGRSSSVEYTITVPTQYHAGHYALSYARDAGPGLATPVFMVKTAKADRTTPVPLIRIDGRVVRPGQRLAMPKPPEPADWEQAIQKEPGRRRLAMSLPGPDVSHVAKIMSRALFHLPAGLMSFSST